MKKTFLMIAAITTTTAFAEPIFDFDRAWERISDPVIMSSTFNKRFAELPRAGKVKSPTKYWSSDYWARKKGGINYRWNSSNPTGFNLASPTFAQASQMSLTRLKTLAPSEKWDLFNGRYDYPTKNEVARYASPDRPLWEGICDGWAGAALNHDEPKPVTVTNPDGIRIPFGSSDIKGLLSWYYAEKYSGGYAHMGRRCNGQTTGVDRCTHDMNAGAFHIVLTNRLGITGEGLTADIDRESQVWNHMTFDYKTTVLDSDVDPLSTSAPGTVKMVKVKAQVRYVWLLSKNTWNPVRGTSRQNTNSRTYTYYLDLDNTGTIIGGEWISRTRPDFLWLEKKVGNFTGSFARLPEILQ